MITSSIIDKYKTLLADIRDTSYVTDIIVPSSYTEPGIVKIDSETFTVTNGVLGINTEKLKRSVTSITDPVISNIISDNTDEYYLTITAQPKRNHVNIAKYIVSIAVLGMDNVEITDIQYGNTIAIPVTGISITDTTSIFVTATAIDTYGNKSATVTKTSKYVSKTAPVIVSPVENAIYKETVDITVESTNDKVVAYQIYDKANTLLYETRSLDSTVSVNWMDLYNLQNNMMVEAYLSNTIVSKETPVVFDDFVIHNTDIYGVSEAKVYMKTRVGFFDMTGTATGGAAGIVSNNTTLVKVLADGTYYCYNNGLWSDRITPSVSVDTAREVFSSNGVVFMVCNEVIYYNTTQYVNEYSWLELPIYINDLIDIIHFDGVYYFLSNSMLFSTTDLTNDCTLVTADPDSEFRSITKLVDKIAVINKSGIIKYVKNNGTITTSSVINNVKTDWYSIDFINPFIVAIGNDGSYCLTIDGGDTWVEYNQTVPYITTSLKHCVFDNSIYYMTNIGLLRRYFAVLTDPFTVAVAYEVSGTDLGDSTTSTFRYEMDTSYPYMLTGAILNDKPVFVLNMTDTLFYHGLDDSSVFKF